MPRAPMPHAHMKTALAKPRRSWVLIPGMGVRDPETMPHWEVFTQFESIGSNCEFGIVQRTAGYDPPGLFRNAGFLDTDQIITAISRNLDRMFDDGQYELVRGAGWPDWMLHCKRFGFGFHTPIPVTVAADDPQRAVLLKKTIAAFRLLKRKFLEDLAEGQKIFVYRFHKTLPDNTVERLLSAIRVHGPGPLLYVREDPAVTSPVVEDRGDGLFVGTMARLSNSDPPIIDFAAWERIARAAIRLRHVVRAEPPPGESVDPSAPPGLPSPQGVAAAMRHEIGLNAADPRLVHVLELAGMPGGRDYVARAWVYVPRDFRGRSLGVTLMGLPPVAYYEADLRRRDCWQMIWVSAGVPPNATMLAPTLIADAEAGSVFYSAGWKVAPESAPPS